VQSAANFEHQVGELLLLQRVAQRIGTILDLEELLEEIVTDVAQTFGYSRAGVLLIEGRDLVIAAVRGWTTNFHMKGERFPVGEWDGGPCRGHRRDILRTRRLCGSLLRS
jgi:hypothetical protein